MTKNYDTQSFPRSSYFEWNRYRFPSSRLERVPPIRPLLNYSNRRKYAVQLAAASPYFPFTPFTETRVFPSHAFSTYLFLTSNFIESFIVSLRSPISEVISISSLSLSLSLWSCNALFNRHSIFDWSSSSFSSERDKGFALTNNFPRRGKQTMFLETNTSLFSVNEEWSSSSIFVN